MKKMGKFGYWHTFLQILDFLMNMQLLLQTAATSGDHPVQPLTLASSLEQKGYTCSIHSVLGVASLNSGRVPKPKIARRRSNIR